MDTSTSQKIDATYRAVYKFLLIGSSTFPTPTNHRNTVIKYTKLPDLEAETEDTWPNGLCIAKPRFRRTVSLVDPVIKTSRSVKSTTTSKPAPNIMAHSCIKRKIVTISEDDESDVNSKISNTKNSQTARTPNSRSTNTTEKNPAIHRPTRLNGSQKLSTECKINPKLYSKKDTSDLKPTPKRKNLGYQMTHETSKINRIMKERESIHHSKALQVVQRATGPKRLSPGKSAIDIPTSQCNDSLNLTLSPTRSLERSKLSSRKHNLQKDKNVISKQNSSNKLKKNTVVHVPLETNTCYMKNPHKEYLKCIFEQKLKKIDSSTGPDLLLNTKDANPCTDIASTINKETEIHTDEVGTMFRGLESTCSQTDPIDALIIPNVSLTKDRDVSLKNNNEQKGIQTDLLPSVITPSIEENPPNDDARNDVDSHNDDENNQISPYIIRHATLTYTTKQKINFRMIGKEDSQSLTTNSIAYPINVVSVYKKETSNCEMTNITTKESNKNKRKNNIKFIKDLNQITSLNCSYVFNSHKLVKPSDIISTMRVNSQFLQSDICEQFQRELNFIDSFFESLQYLESCSLTDRCFVDNKVENWISNSGLGLNKSLLSKLGNGVNFEDSETMASKSLCLLNLLIRDEQRRAKNLLFVLKMREDALKDFTKSQILWLENKKKQDNTDISTLKKKQRGALLKLQHECGEMQRMRKALLTLSERRKVALMKTKKNIELKLRNSADVDQIILGKKKLKRSASDRNVAPVKCFDLSSSGCEEISSSRGKSEVVPPKELPEVTSVEKYVQTADTPAPSASRTDVASELFVGVDGSYLNILFHNLSLPQIFSKGKQYDVNEEALKNFVQSANNQTNFNDSDVIDRFMEQIKNKDSESSSSASTARSLVDELDQYYKDLTENKVSEGSPVQSFSQALTTYDIKEQLGLSDENNEIDNNNCSSTSSSSTDTMLIKDSDDIDDLPYDVKAPLYDIQEEDKVSQTSSQTKFDAACEVFPVCPSDEWLTTKPPSVSESSFSSAPLVTAFTSLTSIQCEAEELRKQQLAIEREIKALEEQQCQLVIVREIPDKPPPPYTPPSEARVPKLPRMFIPEEIAEDRVKFYFEMNESGDIEEIEDPFEAYIRDFCKETAERQAPVVSDDPWHPINVLPQKPALSERKLVRKTTVELAEVLNGVKPTVVPGVTSRRSDHIDDILFTEWRRCEPEWTSLHSDEVLVKSQIFESIFQKILTETIDEYKKTVSPTD